MQSPLIAPLHSMIQSLGPARERLPNETSLVDRLHLYPLSTDFPQGPILAGLDMSTYSTWDEKLLRFANFTGFSDWPDALGYSKNKSFSASEKIAWFLGDLSQK